MVTKKKNPSDTSNVTPPSISDAEVQECLTHLDAVATVLAPYMASLTAKQRKSMTRAQSKVESVIPQLAALAQRFELVSSQVNVEQMKQEAALASALLPIIGRTRTLLGGLADTVLEARSSACGTATTVHSFLKRLAAKNGTLKGELSVVSAAFAKKSRAAKADAAAESTSTAKPAPPGAAPAPAAPTTAAVAG